MSSARFRSRRLVGPLLYGLALAFLTWLIIGDNPYLNSHSYPYPRLIGTALEWLGGAISILLLPGFVAGMAVSGNVHNQDTWVVVSGIFLFYFCLAYLIGRF